MKSKLQNSSKNQTDLTDTKLLEKIWLGREFLKITLSYQGSNVEKEIEEIRLALQEEEAKS